MELIQILVMVNAYLASCAHAMTPSIVTILEENAEMVVAMYGEVTPTFEAPEKVLDTEGITGHKYLYAKIQLYY